MRNEGGSVVEEPISNKVIASVSFDWDRENDGSAGALCDSNAGQRTNERSGADEWMEFDGGSDMPPSI